MEVTRNDTSKGAAIKSFTFSHTVVGQERERQIVRDREKEESDEKEDSKGGSMEGRKGGRQRMREGGMKDGMKEGRKEEKKFQHLFLGIEGWTEHMIQQNIALSQSS